MNEPDGFRIEAALQFGFESTNDDGPYSCTEAQLIAFAKSCERKGRAEAAMWARIRSEAFGTLTTTFQELNSLAADMDAKNVALDAELAPILAAEEERYMTSRGYVRGTDEPGKRWVKA